MDCEASWSVQARLEYFQLLYITLKMFIHVGGKIYFEENVTRCLMEEESKIAN